MGNGKALKASDEVKTAAKPNCRKVNAPPKHHPQLLHFRSHDLRLSSLQATGVALLQFNAMSTGKPAKELVQAAAQTAKATGFKVQRDYQQYSDVRS